VPLSWNLGTLTSWNPLGHSRPLTGLLYLYLLKYVHVYLQLTPPCKTLLVKCIWLDTETDCSELFQLSKSALGICCSFNYFGVNENLRLYVINWELYYIYYKLYTVLSYLGVFIFCTCRIIICLVLSLILSLVCDCCWFDRVYCCGCLVWLLLSHLYLLYYVCIAVFYFRCRTAGQKSVFGRPCDRPPQHRFFSVSLCL
jgi:hypothetical protein